MPYSADQRTAARIALAARKGKTPKSNLKGASLSMYKGMRFNELEDFATGPIKRADTKKRTPRRTLRREIPSIQPVGTPVKLNE